MPTLSQGRRRPTTVEREESIRAAAKQMHSSGVGCVVVVDGRQRPVGVVTDRDVVLRGLRRGRDLDSTPVSEIMSTLGAKTRESTKLATAILRMSTDGVRRLPVVDAHGRLSGIFTYDDAIQAVARDLSSAAEAIRAQMPAPTTQSRAAERTWELPMARHYGQQPVTAGAEATLGQVIDEMDEYGVGCVVIVDADHRPIGIVTDRDVLRRVVSAGIDVREATVNEVMSRDVVTTAESSSIPGVLEQARTRGIRRIPLVDDVGRLVGIVSVDDVIAQLASELSHLSTAVRVELRESRRVADTRRAREEQEEALETLHAHAVGADTRDWLKSEISDLAARLGGDES